jgi:hypothetical protein
MAPGAANALQAAQRRRSRISSGGRQ